MPREVVSPNQELEGERVGTRPLRKRHTSWKQPLVEAATWCEPLINSAARLSQMGGDQSALRLTTNECPECTPLDDTELLVVQWGSCQYQRRQKADGTAGASAWPILTNADNTH